MYMYIYVESAEGMLQRVACKATNEEWGKQIQTPSHSNRAEGIYRQ